MKGGEPAQAWRRESQWFEPDPRAAGESVRPERQERDHALLGVRLRCARPVWENAAGEGESEWLREYQVQGSAVYPPAAYVEMAIAACRHGAEPTPVLIRDVEFLKPLVLKAGQAVPIQFTFDPETNRFEVFSSAGPDGVTWIRHARGTASILQTREVPRFDLTAVRERVPNAASPEEFYNQLADRSLLYGPLFRGIKELCTGGGEALGFIELAGSLDSKGYCVHPALLDAAFQVMVAAAGSTPSLAGLRSLLPAQIQEFRFYSSPGERARCRAVIVAATDANVSGDLQIFNEHGDTCIQVKGFTATLADASGSASRDTIDQWLYDYRWEPVPLLAENPGTLADSASGEPAQSIILGRRPVESAEAKPWLIIADERGVGKRLAKLLRPSVLAATHEQATPGDYQGIVHLRNLDASSLNEGMIRASPLDCGGVITILRSLSASPLAERPFVMVTAGAQTPIEGETPALLQSPVWGLARVLRNEWPNLRSQIIDLSTECADQEIAALAREILATQELRGPVEEEIAIRASQRFVRRLRPVTRARIADSIPSEAGPEEQWHVELSSAGSFFNLAVRRAARVDPAPHEVEVAIGAAGLNFRDVVVAMRAVPNLETEQSLGSRQLGLDLAGTVTRCGDAVRSFRPGDEVLGIAKGTLSAYGLVHASLLAPRPRRLNVEQASSIPVAFVTAHYALRHLARLARGESILIHAASGAVGLAALQMAKIAGARIYATAGSAAKRSYLESLGVEHVMDSRSLGFADEIIKQTDGRGVDVVLNSLGGEAMNLGVASLAPYGRFVELGKTEIYRNGRLQLLPFRKNLSFFSVDLDRMCFERAEFVGRLLREVAEEFASGVLVPIPYTEFPMNEARAALRYIAQAKHIGKVVVTNKGPVAARKMIHDVVPVRGDATYLLTGGSGMSFSAARWLAERGAGSIVLLERRPPSPEMERHMADLRDAGTRIEVVACDVANPADVEAVFERLRAEFPLLRGVVHAAAVPGESSLAELTEEQWKRVTMQKIAGAWNLHCCMREDKLDFFVMFSSVTSLLGSPSQADCAAANAFLDSFATWRRRRGLVATTITWGVIPDSNDAGRSAEAEGQLHQQGYAGFTVKQTFEVLSELIRHDVVQIVAARIDWRRLRDYAPAVAASPRIRHLIPALCEPQRNS